MLTFSSAFTAGLAVVTLLLAAPAAQAQSTGFMAAELPASTSEMASSRPATEPADDVPSDKIRHPNGPNEEAGATHDDDPQQELKQSLSWMQETNALYPEYWSLYAEARIRLQLQDYSGAHATAAEAKKLALAASPANADYARRSDILMTQAKACLK